jgi:hypothetical protein
MWLGRVGSGSDQIRSNPIFCVHFRMGWVRGQNISAGTRPKVCGGSKILYTLFACLSAAAACGVDPTGYRPASPGGRLKHTDGTELMMVGPVDPTGPQAKRRRPPWRQREIMELIKAGEAAGRDMESGGGQDKAHDERWRVSRRVRRLPPYIHASGLPICSRDST